MAELHGLQIICKLGLLTSPGMILQVWHFLKTMFFSTVRLGGWFFLLFLPLVGDPQLVDDWHIIYSYIYIYLSFCFRGSFCCWTLAMEMWRARSIEFSLNVWDHKIWKHSSIDGSGFRQWLWFWAYTPTWVVGGGVIYKFLLRDSTFIISSFVSCVLGGSLLPRHVVSYPTSLNEFLSFHCET